MRRVRMVECDKLTCHQPDRLAYSVRTDPGLVGASCPGSGCLRPAAIGALAARRAGLLAAGTPGSRAGDASTRQVRRANSLGSAAWLDQT